MMENSFSHESNPKRQVSKKALDKTWWTWFKYCLGVFGFERLEAPGFAMSMIDHTHHLKNIHGIRTA